MKKYICLTFCLCMILLLVGCKSPNANALNENSNKSGEISKDVEFKVSDENSKIWLDNSHIEKVSLKTDEAGKKALLFTTTEEGKTILYNATSENIDKSLYIHADNSLLLSMKVSTPIENGEFTLYNVLVEHTYLYNYLTGAKDLMADVTPPDDLISEDTAKNNVFKRARITADDVSELSIELKIDQDFWNWIYVINFTANDKEYTSEVNAYTGGITKFIF